MPYRVRERMSWLAVSVPNQCAEDGPSRFAPGICSSGGVRGDQRGEQPGEHHGAGQEHADESAAVRERAQEGTVWASGASGMSVAAR
ncbi:MAG: hypothetical protein L0J86_03025, partial [Corynebacterium sp.]|nr:hypothetical protein [Corynebacterium sp.]